MQTSNILLISSYNLWSAAIMTRILPPGDNPPNIVAVQTALIMPIKDDTALLSYCIGCCQH